MFCIPDLSSHLVESCCLEDLPCSMLFGLQFVSGNDIKEE
jgi:hypothetical protein